MPFEDYTPKQKKLAMIAEPRDKITAADLKKLRKGQPQRKYKSVIGEDHCNQLLLLLDKFDKLQKFNKKHNLNNLESCLLFISRISSLGNLGFSL